MENEKNDTDPLNQALKDTTTNQLKEVPEDLICTICYEIFTNPVTLNCGHTFCRNCLEQCLNTKPACPTCRAPVLVDINHLSENITLKNLINSNYKEHLELKLSQSQIVDVQALQNHNVRNEAPVVNVQNLNDNIEGNQERNLNTNHTNAANNL
jgi:Zinc finger, C3HC4 type (RING finger)